MSENRLSRQPDDLNDWTYRPPPDVKSLPSVDLRSPHLLQEDTYDQGDFGTCTANAIASALRFGKNAKVIGTRNIPHESLDPSWLYVYYQERIMNATKDEWVDLEALIKFLESLTEDLITVSGKTIHRQDVLNELKKHHRPHEHNSMKSRAKESRFSEHVWQRSNKKDNPDDALPPKGASQNSSNYPGFETTYYRIKDLFEGAGPDLIAHMEAALTEGYPVVFGFHGSQEHAPLNFERGLDKDHVYTGWLQDGDEPWGHCVLAVGYDRAKALFLILNSWGSEFGDNGYFWMPYRWFGEKDSSFLKHKNPQRRLPRVGDFWVLKCQVAQPETA